MVHASAAAVAGQGVLILGRSGAGKSMLTLQLMAFGAMLLSDDRTLVAAREGRLWASAPAAIRGMVEARGVGLLAAETSEPMPLSLVVDLDQVEGDRLPAQRFLRILDHELPLIRRVDHPAFPAAVLQYLKGGRTG